MEQAGDQPARRMTGIPAAPFFRMHHDGDWPADTFVCSLFHPSMATRAVQPIQCTKVSAILTLDRPYLGAMEQADGRLVECAPHRWLALIADSSNLNHSRKRGDFHGQ